DLGAPGEQDAAAPVEEAAGGVHGTGGGHAIGDERSVAEPAVAAVGGERRARRIGARRILELADQPYARCGEGGERLSLGFGDSAARVNHVVSCSFVPRPLGARLWWAPESGDPGTRCPLR